jgi:pimeloyl-ACP methyl ester carboxylesterase
VVAPDLPCEDESAGWSEYAGAVAGAIGDRTGVVVVAQSLGAFTAPLLCSRVPVQEMVLLAGLVPAPGERAEDWWTNTGYEDATRDRDEYNEVELFLHDVPPDLAAEAMARGRRQAAKPTREPWPLEAWPDVPTRYLLCRDDRLLPAEWNRGIVRRRLGIDPDEIDGGHCVALSRPGELAERLEAYRLRRS